MTTLNKILLSLAAVVLVAAVVVFYHLQTDRGSKYPGVDADDPRIPQYENVPFPFANRYDAENSLPIVASAIIDADGDGVEEVFVGGGIGQADGLMKYENGAFRDIAAEAGLQKDLAQTTIGAAVTDLDHDTLPDLLVSREGAVSFYKNLGGRFAATQNLNIVFE